MSEAANPGGGDEVVPAGFSAEDLRLGRKATRNIRVLCVAALVASAANAGFVFLNVPWDTRMPYDGQFDRSGNGIPMQIAMLPCLLLLIRIWWDGRRPDAHRMRKGSRIGTYILGSGLIGVCVLGQWVVGQTILEAGGYLGG